MGNHTYKRYINALAKGKEPITDAISLNTRIMLDVEAAQLRIKEQDEIAAKRDDHPKDGFFYGYSCISA
jgi:hypothetical protein